MDPSSNESFGMQLPPPVETAPATASDQAETGQTAAEKAPSKPEQAPQAPNGSPSQSAAVPPVIPLPLPPSPPASSQDDTAAAQGGAMTSALPAVADDNDLIEKEWVNKAKAIIASTRDDPYRQSEELTAVKADYMQKRYNKTIKVSK